MNAATMTVEEAVIGLKARHATYDETLVAYKAAGGMALSKDHPARKAFRNADLDVHAYTSDNVVRPLLKQAMATGVKFF